jgi:hypothetical protein
VAAAAIMAAAGTIEQMPWSRLRPRQAEPPAVLAAIPPEDVHTFLRMLAKNPLQPFPDASVVRRRVLVLRNVRADTAREAFLYVSSHAFASRLSSASCQPKLRHHQF